MLSGIELPQAISLPEFRANRKARKSRQGMAPTNAVIEPVPEEDQQPQGGDERGMRSPAVVGQSSGSPLITQIKTAGPEVAPGVTVLFQAKNVLSDIELPRAMSLPEFRANRKARKSRQLMAPTIALIEPITEDE